ncbi:MAG: bacteriophage receptor-2C outer rane subunit [Flavipsychrobacter sp.]|jgi:tetratricopeptide (TPR) repeat protein|nr:bacteriophage receptor-2C outer rane subunit [Flavipsychrobacter sp.]
MAKTPQNKPIPKQAPAKQPVQQKAVKSEVSKWFSVKYLCIILAVVSFALYANTLQNGFVLDDKMVLRDNVYVQQGFGGVVDLLTTPHMRGYLVIPNDLYRPLSLVMFAIEYELFGASPVGYHFFNILTFIGCVIMLFLFLNKFFGEKKTAIAFIAALIFAVHPIHTEVVANIKSRDELMSYFFGFWSLNLFMNYMKQGKMAQLLLGIFALYLAYISKETVIAFVGIIPLLFFFYANEDKKRAVFITVGMLVATGIFLAIRTVVLDKYDANQPGTAIDFIDNALSQAPSVASKIATEFYIIGKYLWLMFIPYPLLANYSYNAIPFVGFGDIRAILSILAYGGLVFVAISRFIKNKKDPWVFAIVFYLGTLFLFSNFPFLMGAEMAERFAFFASTGMCIAVALAIEKWILKEQATNIQSLKNSKVLTILIPLCLMYGGMTIARNFDWKDEYTLYKADLEKSPNDARINQFLATAISENLYPEETDSLKRREMDIESMQLLRQALVIYPEFAEAHVQMGRVMERLHMYDSAIAANLKALAIKPMNSIANNNLGSVYINLGKFREAIPYLLRSVEANPSFKFVYMNLGNCYSKVNAHDSAARNFAQYLVFEPGNMDVTKKLATSYYMLQKYDSVEFYMKQVLAAAPNDLDALNMMGAIYLNTKKYPQAAEQFKKAISINPNYILAYSNLGKLYYNTQQYDAAIEILTKEYNLTPKNGDLPYLALSYQKKGNMDMARKFEALAKQVYSNFKLE